MKDKALAGKQKSEAVWRASQETAARRKQIAAHFREKLLVELGTKNPTASRGALVDVAVSAYTQASELSTYFLAGRATPGQVAQMSIARGQLHRALRALGLVDRDGDDAPNDVASELNQIEQRIRQTEPVNA